MDKLDVCEKHEIKSDVADSQLSDDLHYVIQQANNCLLLRQFEDCLDICQKNITIARNYTENDRINDFYASGTVPAKLGWLAALADCHFYSARASLESLVAIAIQAYAELNRWREVVPFVSQTYNGMEDCPSLIAHLCLSLHAHLQDSVMCSIIANIWLKNPSNFHVDGYQSLTEMYIVKVLCVSHLWDDVRPFLDSCLGLSESTRDSIARHVAAYRKDVEANSIEILESDVNVAAGNNRQAIDSTVGQIHVIDDWLPQWMKYLRDCVAQQLQKYVPYISLRVVKKTSIALVILYAALSQWKRGECCYYTTTAVSSWKCKCL